MVNHLILIRMVNRLILIRMVNRLILIRMVRPLTSSTSVTLDLIRMGDTLTSSVKVDVLPQPSLVNLSSFYTSINVEVVPVSALLGPRCYYTPTSSPPFVIITCSREMLDRLFERLPFHPRH